MFQRIVVAVDSEPTMAHQVLAEAMAVAQASQASLHIIQVLYPLKSGYPDPMYMTLDGAFNTVNLQTLETYINNWEKLRSESQTALQAYVDGAQANGIRAEASQLMGEPGREICNLAKSWNADLIVMGRRGIKGIGEFLLGSVSNFVMHRAPCAVLIVKGDPPVEPETRPVADPSVAS